MEIQKEQYLNLRKNLLRDKTNIFEEIENSNDEKTNLSKISAGPSPFLNNMSLNLTGPNINPGNCFLNVFIALRIFMCFLFVFH